MQHVLKPCCLPGQILIVTQASILHLEIDMHAFTMAAAVYLEIDEINQISEHTLT